MDHERTAEAGAEGDLWFFAKANFSSGDLGGVAGNKMIQRLVGGEAGDRRHDARCIAGEQDDILRMTGPFFGDGIVDEFQRIRSACVFGQRIVIQIDQAGDRIEDHIFKDRAKTACGGKYLRLGGGERAITLA